MSTKRLPLYGVGPAFFVFTMLTTMVGRLLSKRDFIPFFSLGPLGHFSTALAVLLLIIAAYLWIDAVLFQRLQDGIYEHRLITTGVYAVVRNPIYTAILFLSWSILLLDGNLYLLILVPLQWLFLSVLLIHTEEKWLEEAFGDEYLQYCSRVNRCIPWFKKK